MTTCNALITPVGMKRMTIPLKQEPTWTQQEQGGFTDCTVHADLDDELVSRLRRADLAIETPFGVQWFGDIKSVDGDVIAGRGQHGRLAEASRRAVVYRHEGNNGWQVGFSQGFGGSLGDSSADTLQAQVNNGVTFSSNSNRVYFNHDFEQAISSVKLIFDWTLAGLSSSNVEWVARYKTAFSQAYETTTPWTSSGASGTEQSVTINAANLTSVCLEFRNKSGASWTSAAEAYPSITNLRVYGSSLIQLADCTIANIASDILDDCGVGLRDIAAISTQMPDLAFGRADDPLAKLQELLKYADIRFFYESRMDQGVFKPCAVLDYRPTTPRYFLTEGEGVAVDLDPSTSENLVRTMNVMFTDSSGRNRYVEVRDSDESHYLVFAGLESYDDMQVETKSATLASAAGFSRTSRSSRARSLA
jgi:hypothetical protein